MSNTLLNIIYFIGSFLLVFLSYTFIINRNKKTYKDATKQFEVLFLIKRFDLDKSKIPYKKIKMFINIINSLIISITFIIVTNIKSLILGVLIGFIIMIALIYSLYEILGRILKQRSEKDV